MTKFGDFVDELGEQAQEFGQTAVKQVIGKSSSKPADSVPKAKENKKAPVTQDLVEEMYPKPVDPKKMAKLQQKESATKAQELSQARIVLQRAKIERYQRLQQKILEEEQKREGEIPEYEAGKPGAARTQKEKIALETKKQREEQQKQSGVQLPSSASHMPGLDAVIKQNQGSKEVKLGKIG